MEVYLRDCLDSILDQSYRELEILLIEDGSPDKCPEICDEYAKQDSRIRVVHQENRGLSVARNTGMELASGSFWCFVDSDDIISREFVGSLYQACIETGSEIAMCGFCKKTDGLDVMRNGRVVYDGYEMSCRLNRDDTGFYGVVWNKLYRRELFDGVRFPVGKIHEDEFITYQLFWKAKKCVVLDNVLYYYRQRPNSIVSSAFSERHMDAALAYKERIGFYMEKGAVEPAVLAKACYCHFLRKNKKMISAVGCNFEYWKKEMLTAYLSVMISGLATPKKKLSLSLHMISPFLYQKTKEVYQWMHRR